MKINNIQVLTPENFRSVMEARLQEGMDFLENLVGMDWGPEEGLGVVYQLTRTATGESLWYKITTQDRENPVLPTVSDLWKIANVYEREVYDYYGIRFLNHPDMRRLFLREDWEGWPMRKDDPTQDQNPLRMTNEPLATVTTQLCLGPDGRLQTQENEVFGPREYIVNMGPQHPSTHGVLHFRMSIEGEYIRKLDPVLGYIHRGIEKLNEQLTYPQTLALTDRLDYLSCHQSRHALCMCIEEALGIEVSERVKTIRTLMDELQRIDSHILFFSCLCQDMGATTAFLYGFRDREKILDIFEETCGGRLIMNYNTIGGVMADLHPNFVQRVKDFIPVMRRALKEYENIFGGNLIAHNRMDEVGILRREDAISYGCTGGAGRASGWHNDVRKLRPYACYAKVDFEEVVFPEGDAYARYKVRMHEIEQSLRIIEQLIDHIPEGPIQEKTKAVIKVPEGLYYTSVESSRGTFGVFLESRGEKSPYRLHYRSTGLPLVAAMDTVCRDCKIADLIAIGGTMDYIVPDIDR